jgi:hypothetical protein
LNDRPPDRNVFNWTRCVLVKLDYTPCDRAPVYFRTPLTPDG